MIVYLVPTTVLTCTVTAMLHDTVMETWTLSVYCLCISRPNSGHFRFEIVFFLEAAFSAAVFILCVLHQHLAIIPAKIRLEATVLCAQRVLMFGTVNLTF